MSRDTPSARTIVALDVRSAAEALELVDRLQGIAGMFKVGLELFISEGPSLVRAIVDRGENVFLDLKLHDIPNTVSRAAREAAELGVSMLTLHGAGGPAMIGVTRERLDREFGAQRPRILGVTVLTSLDDRTLAETGVLSSAAAQVLRLATMIRDAGGDGCVCSPKEVRAVRQQLGARFEIVTPGVRMAGQLAGDQARIASPYEAIADGADWIVIGRYVNQADDPRQALLDVVESLETS